MARSSLNVIGEIIVIIGAMAALFLGAIMIFFNIWWFLFWGVGHTGVIGILIMFLAALVLAFAGVYHLPWEVAHPPAYILILGFLLVIFNAHLTGIAVIIGAILMFF